MTTATQTQPKKVVPHVRVRRHGEASFRLHIAVFFRTKTRRDACKRAMAGGRWDGRGGWVVTPDKVHAIVRRLRIEGFNVAVDDEALELYERREVERVHDESVIVDRLRRLDDALRGRGKAMYPFQVVGATWLALRDRALLGDDMGVGKAQPVSETVLTPEGWREIGTLRVGDLVAGSSGGFVRVVGVFPQGVKPVYRVRTADGCETRACGEHLWHVQTSNDRARRSFRVLSTEGLLAEGFTNECWGPSRAKANLGQRTRVRSHRFFLPVPAPVRHEERSFAVHPYLLGALLANGCLGQSILHSGGVDQRAEFAPYLPEGVSIREIANDEWSVRLTTGVPGRANSLLDAIRALGLQRTESHERFVPSEYLFGSVAQRVALLQGLCDNDGTVDARGYVVEYNTTSARLAADVVYLVRSLGGVALTSTRVPHFTVRGVHKAGRVDHRIRMSLPDGICPFRLSRKVERFTPRTKYPPSRPLASIEPDGEAECVCIKVDAPDHLYVTRDFVVTHNTLQTIAALPRDAAVVVVCTASTKGNWAKEFVLWRPEFRISILSGRDSFRWPRPGEAAILNYDVLPDNHASSCSDRLPDSDENEAGISFDETIRRAEEAAKRPPCAGCAEHLSSLQEEGVSYVVVADEAQKLRTSGTLRTDRFRALSTAVRSKHGRVWLTTGTPLSSRPTDLWTLLDAADLAREAFGSWTNFVDIFGGEVKRIANGKFAGVRWDASKVKPEAAERLAAVMLRRLKKDVLTELPDRTWRTVPVEVSEEDLRYVDEVMRHAGMTTESVTRAITEGRGEMVIGKMSQARAALAASKTRALVDFVRDEFEACGEPVVVFSAHRQPIEHLGKRAGWATIMGDVSARKRTGIIDDFQAGKLKGIGLTIAAGGEGITLTRAWNVVFVDRDWTPSANAQAEDRIYRIGQKNACVVTDLVTTHPLDLRVTEVLVEKSRMIAGTVDAAAVREGAST